MDLSLPCHKPGAAGPHPSLGKEVMVMDDVSNDVEVDVHVRCVSINRTSNRKERMGEHE